MDKPELLEFPDDLTPHGPFKKTTDILVLNLDSGHGPMEADPDLSKTEVQQELLRLLNHDKPLFRD